MDSIQKIQEEEYDFPYHHVPEYKNGYFSQCLNFTWGINYLATIDFLINQLRKEEFESLIDIGCGDGRITKELNQSFPKKIVEGIDYSQKSINLAKALYQSDIYHCSNIIDGSFQRQYDIALLIEVFEHIHPSECDIFIKSVARLIKENGILILTVPHINQPIESKHYRHFSVDSISQSLNEYFNILEVIPFEKKDFRKKTIDLLLTNKLFILNNGRLKSAIYKYYVNHLFYAKNENNCKRIYVKAMIKSNYN